MAASRMPGRWRVFGWLLTGVLVLVTFALALIADTASVARLAWACLTGQLGIWPRVVTGGVAASVAAVFILARWPARRPHGPALRRQGSGASTKSPVAASRNASGRRKPAGKQAAKT